ncbi:hypothetical protein ARMSODRAFT_957037 [Armillaria solidipes]|uniref:Uncharacterized protein n=1 Tax=Armillaria solidipes TaxID=1076256 RepID=A0A2H3BKJ2_9AGAR|nr:hypothetical protein ARMSODRAFT_957037 [Armillaria solidipes]
MREGQCVLLCELPAAAQCVQLAGRVDERLDSQGICRHRRQSGARPVGGLMTTGVAGRKEFKSIRTEFHIIDAIDCDRLTRPVISPSENEDDHHTYIHHMDLKAMLTACLLCYRYLPAY